MSTHQSFSSCLKMKIQSVVFLTAVLMLTTLVDEEECLQNGKREYQEKVLKRLLTKLIKLRLIRVRVYTSLAYLSSKYNFPPRNYSSSKSACMGDASRNSLFAL